jgi:hypothetical protein
MNNAMEIVKKHLLSILCGVVAIAAVVALFWPISGMYEGLQADVEKSEQMYKTVENLHKAERRLPSLVLDAVEQPRLERFPNERVITVGQEKTTRLKEQSDRMLKTVSELNFRKPLVSGSLPVADSARTEFPEVYLTYLGQTDEGFKTDLGLPRELRATQPPTPEEINEVAEGIWKKDFMRRIIRLGGQPHNLEQVTEEFQAAIGDLPKKEREKRATQSMIYLEPEGLPVSNEIQLGKQPTDVQIWFAQSVLWITEDVVKAINEANKGAKNILNAPVKHLISLRVPFGPDQYVLPAGGAAMASAEGEASLPVNANGVPEMFSLSPTGRVCNPIYDVIHFDLVLRVDYRKIPQVLAELERNQLVTVLGTSVTAVDSEQELQNGYMYGNEPVAELTIRAESLFLRSWTIDKDNNYKAALMPEIVQATVGAREGPGLSGTGGGGSGGGGQSPYRNKTAPGMNGFEN